jgi:hypothetical protein
MRKRLLHRLQPLLLLISLALVALLLRSQWTELQAHPWRLHGGWLVVSAAALLAAWFIEVNLWQRLLAGVGGRLPFGPAWRIWFLTALVRYVPGNIWQPLSMTLYCQQWGVRPEATLMSMVLYQAVTLLAVAPIAALYLLLNQQTGLWTGLLAGATPWLVGVGLAPLLIFLIRPAWLVALVNWALRRIGRPALEATLSTGRLLLFLSLGVLSWLLWGASFAALTFGLRVYAHDDILRLAPYLVAVFSVGYAIGFLSLITPSGFGVREGAYYLLLTPLLDGGAVTVAALAMRIWIVLGEVIMAGLSAIGLRGPVAETSSQPTSVFAPTPVSPYVAPHEPRTE